MSVQHPIVAVTGSSGAGTTTVQDSFANIFRREGIRPVFVEGDSFHRYDREEMELQRQRCEEEHGWSMSHFGPQANMFEELGELFKGYSQTGTGKVRKYLHDAEQAAEYNQQQGTFSPWQDIHPDTDMLFYDRLRGSVNRRGADY